MRRALCLVFLSACGTTGSSDAGSDAGSMDCSVSDTCSTEGARCTRGIVDDACSNQCTCTAGRWGCQRVCPPHEPCRNGGYCATPEACATPLDGGCFRDCECRQSIPGFYATCVRRCGGVQGQCFDAGTADGGALSCSPP